jgi:hypothetical protein
MGREVSRKDWTTLATFYELDGRPGFAIASKGLAKHLNLANSWPEIAPEALAKGRPISLDEFQELRDKWAPDIGHALCQNRNLNVWLEEHGLISPPP